jgi:hypothetical protein
MGLGAAMALAGMGGAALAAPEDLDALLDGVSEISAPGCLPGPVMVFGDSAFAVVTANCAGGKLPLVAAARLGKGRVVAFGHEGLLGGDTGDPDNARFLANIVRWLGPTGRKARVAVADREALVPPLQQAGFEAGTVSGEQIRAGLEGWDVLIASGFAFDDDADGAKRDALVRFIEAGGGFLTGTCPWGWAQLRPGKAIATDLGANLVLQKAGMAWGGETVGETGKRGYVVDRAGLALTSGAEALAALERHVAGTALSEADLKQASTVVSCAVRALPRGDTGFVSRVRSLCDANAGGVYPGPDSPVSSQQPFARLAVSMYARDSADLAPDAVRVYPGADLFPGPVPGDAERVTETVAIPTTPPAWFREGSWRRKANHPYAPEGEPVWHGTGLYAPAGEVVRVEVPQEAAAKGLGVRIGCHTDTIWDHAKWQRFPEISRRFPVTGTSTSVASPFGGLIYIEIPAGLDLGDLSVTMSGAVRAPRFVYGKTSLVEWRERIRNHPAPWAELETDGVVAEIPSDVARSVDDPETVLAFWQHVLDSCADLYQWPRERLRPERYCADVQISAGYMHSGYPIMTWLDSPHLLTDVPKLMKSGDWGLFHETGHNHQSEYWDFEGTGEVTENLFSVYGSEMCCDIEGQGAHPGLNGETQQKRLAAHIAAGSPFAEWTRDPFFALYMYMQLKEAFGWGAFKRVFRAYLDAPQSELPRSNDEKRDQWMVRFSREVGRNLGPFFQAWGVPTSEAARQSIADLPTWLPPDFPTRENGGPG